MGMTQFVQTKMTPSTADPMQQKMMMFMPLMFMFMFIWAPSGLVLYWTVSNLWAIGQQALTNRLIGPPRSARVRPPAERRVKNAGGGRSRAGGEGAEVDGSARTRSRVHAPDVSPRWGCTLDVAIDDTPDGIRVEISGEGGETLLRRRAEALDALQHIVNTAFRRELERRPVVRRRLPRLPQGQGRRAAADGAVHDGEGARPRAPQEMGPLNPYARRLVHLTVAEDPALSSESIGDAFLKTVIISVRR